MASPQYSIPYAANVKPDRQALLASSNILVVALDPVGHANADMHGPGPESGDSTAKTRKHGQEDMSIQYSTPSNIPRSWLSRHCEYLIWLKPKASAGAFLPESIRIVLEPGLQCLVPVPVASPVVLAIVGIVHEEGSVHIRQRAFFDQFAHDIIESPVHMLKGSVDLGIVRGE
jgi:hypothetical protein